MWMPRRHHQTISVCGGRQVCHCLKPSMLSTFRWFAVPVILTKSSIYSDFSFTGSIHFTVRYRILVFHFIRLPTSSSPAHSSHAVLVEINVRPPVKADNSGSEADEVTVWAETTSALAHDLHDRTRVCCSSLLLLVIPWDLHLRSG